MIYLWRLDDDGVERLLAVIHEDDFLRLIGPRSNPGRYSWQKVDE